MDPSGAELPSLLPALQSGFFDAINPCAFTTLLIFVTVLAYLGRRPAYVLIYGFLFCSAAVTVSYLSVMGVWDPFLTMDFWTSIIHYLYLLVATCCLYMAVVHMKDWWTYKVSGDSSGFRIRLPVFFTGAFAEEVSRYRRASLLIKNMFLVAASGSLFSVISTVYPQSEYLYIVHSYWLSGGNRGFVMQSFAAYSIAVNVALFVVWGIILVIAVFRQKAAPLISWYKGLMAVLNIAVGIGLGYYFMIQS